MSTIDDLFLDEKNIIKDFFNEVSSRIFSRVKMNDLITIKNYLNDICECELNRIGFTLDTSKNPDKEKFVLNYILFTHAKYLACYKHGDFNFSILDSYYQIDINMNILMLGLYSEIKEERLLCAKNILFTLFHELEHHKQYLMTQSNISNYDSLSYARDFALIDSLDRKWYSVDILNGNYQNYFIENSADFSGCDRLIKLIGSDYNFNNFKDISLGKKTLAGYKAKVSDFSGKSFYDMEMNSRDFVASYILDDLIVNNKHNDLLFKYPILQKEYNLDGTKKTAEELYKNMLNEVAEISKNISLDDDAKNEVIKDIKNMYVELIYNAIFNKKSNNFDYEQLENLILSVGNDNILNLFEYMNKYFLDVYNSIDEKSKKMLSLFKEKNYGLSFDMYMYVYDDFNVKNYYQNNGYIEPIQNGQKSVMDFYDFIKIINPNLLNKKFKINTNGEIKEISAKEFIKNYIFSFISKDGYFWFLNGQKFPANKFIELYILNDSENIIIDNIDDYIVSLGIITNWEDAVIDRKKYYEDKISNINKLCKYCDCIKQM